MRRPKRGRYHPQSRRMPGPSYPRWTRRTRLLPLPTRATSGTRSSLRPSRRPRKSRVLRRQRRRRRMNGTSSRIPLPKRMRRLPSKMLRLTSQGTPREKNGFRMPSRRFRIFHFCQKISSFPGVFVRPSIPHFPHFSNGALECVFPQI